MRHRGPFLLASGLTARKESDPRAVANARPGRIARNARLNTWRRIRLENAVLAWREMSITFVVSAAIASVHAVSPSAIMHSPLVTQSVPA